MRTHEKLMILNSVIEDWCNSKGVQLSIEPAEGYLQHYVKLTMTKGIYYNNHMLPFSDFKVNPIYFLEQMLDAIIVHSL